VQCLPCSEGLKLFLLSIEKACTRIGLNEGARRHGSARLINLLNSYMQALYSVQQLAWLAGQDMAFVLADL
jgi:hypothetical protein